MKKKEWFKNGASLLVIAAFLLVGATVSFAFNQDQLVHVSKSATMLFLGIGMIGLGVVGRKKFLKK
jgi:hypothetical protein